MHPFKKNKPTNLACISSVYGSNFHKIITPWITWNQKHIPNHAKYYLLNLDNDNCSDLTHHSLIEYIHTSRKKSTVKHLKWGDGDLPRLNEVIKLCNQDCTCIHLDLDVALLKNIQPIINLPYSFIISRAYGFPKHTVNKIGFVGCTGFYIAKPEAIPLLCYWKETMEDSTPLDQQAINNIFEKLEWKHTITTIDSTPYYHSYSVWNGISILVLDEELILRNITNKSKKNYGIHHPLIIKKYWKKDTSH